MALLMAAKQGEFDAIRKMASAFQAANQRMRYSPVPVVSAPFNLTLGGGAEAAMGANAIQASAELYMGLVEVGVGLIPGGGGTMQLLRNVYGTYASDKDFDPLPFLKKVFLVDRHGEGGHQRRGGARGGLPHGEPTASAPTGTSCWRTPSSGCWAWRRRASGRLGPRASGCRGPAARPPST